MSAALLPWLVAIATAETAWKRIMFAPFRNIATALPTVPITIHTPNPRSSMNDGVTSDPTHTPTILVPRATSTSAGGTVANNETCIDLISVRRTHGVSPRTMASLYAGQRGISAKATSIGITMKRR